MIRTIGHALEHEIARAGARNPFIILFVAFLVTAAAAPGLLRLGLRTDGHALVPAEAVEVADDREIRAAFDVDDLIVVLIRTPPDAVNGIYDPDTLALVETLTDEIAALPEIGRDRVSSLATESGDRHAPDTLVYRTLLDPSPVTPADLVRVRTEIEALEIHVGTLVSDEHRGTAIHVGVAPDADRAALCSQIERIVRPYAADEILIDVIGAPVAEALLGAHLLQDLGVPDAILPEAQRAISAADDVGEAPVWRRLGRSVGLVPLALAIMAIALFVAFRRAAAAPLPLLEVGACLVTVFGVMGWLGIPVYLTTAVLPVILTSVGIADDVHVLSRYQDHLRRALERGSGRASGTGHERRPHAPAVVATVRDLLAPIVQTSVTTAIAFGAFALSPIEPVQAFGVFAAIGVIFCMAWSIFVTPALLTLIPARFIAHPRRVRGRARAERLAVGAARRRWWVGAALVVFIGVAVIGVGRISVQDSWISGFARESAFARATRWFDTHFYGMHVLLVGVEDEARLLTGVIPDHDVDHHALRLPGNVIDDPARLVDAKVRVFVESETATAAERPADVDRLHGGWLAWIVAAERQGDLIHVRTDQRQGSMRVGAVVDEGLPLRFEVALRPLRTPAGMRRMAALESHLASRCDLGVGGVLGPARFLTTTSFIVSGRDREARVIPDDPQRVGWLWDQYRRVRGARRAAQVIDADGGRGLVTVFLRNANYRSTQRLIDDLAEWEREHGAGFTLTLGGDVAVSQALIEGIVRTQVRSLLASLLAIVVLTTVMTRSLKWGVLSVIPCATAVLFSFALMGYGGIPLGVSTSMFAGMVLGIGVDYAIHFIQQYRRAIGAEGSGAGTSGPRAGDRIDAIRSAADTAGRAIVIDALVVGLGFGVLLCSQVPANVRLGAMAAICIAACLVATLVLLPALLGSRAEPREPAAGRATEIG